MIPSLFADQCTNSTTFFGGYTVVQVLINVDTPGCGTSMGWGTSRKDFILGNSHTIYHQRDHPHIRVTLHSTKRALRQNSAESLPSINKFYYCYHHRRHHHHYHQCTDYHTNETKQQPDA